MNLVWFIYIYISILCFWESIKYHQTKYCDAHVYWYFLTPLLRWHIFESWCMTHHADQVHCHVVSVLEFLQEKLSPCTCPGTLRFYVGAISACHTLIDRVSVGEHPLVTRSICEAKQMRLPTIATVHLWDLAVKLLCTRSGWDPFEPLELAPVRFLTLKMVFLMVIITSQFSEENWGFAGSVSLTILLRLCPWAGQSYFASSP